MTREQIEEKLQDTMLRFLGLARELGVPVGPELFQMVESTVRASVAGAVSQAHEEAAQELIALGKQLDPTCGCYTKLYDLATALRQRNVNLLVQEPASSLP